MTEPTKLPRRAQQDLAELENAIRAPNPEQGWDSHEEERRPSPPRIATHAPVRAAPTPPRIDHELSRVENLGPMAAEAVRTQYDEAAKAFEVMGEEIKDRIAKLHASLEEADASMKLLTEAAAAIREKGKLAHMQVEEMSGVAKMIRELHGEVMKKVGPQG